MDIHNYLNKNQKAYTLSTADALWVKHDYPLLEVTDRPFVFLIQEKSTEHTLFMGKVITPTL